jgi:[ribosomal protein S5]-alanine N-acetyltransferase
MSVIRRLTAADAEELTALRVRNRPTISEYEPDWDDPEAYYTVDGVRLWITDGHERFAILDGDAIAGMISLTGISYGAFCSANLGYFVDSERTGRGLATAAIAETVAHGFAELGLHRIEAGTAVDNVASQRVLEKNRFTRVGLMRAHLLIHGEWVDHYLWERIVGD